MRTIALFGAALGLLAIGVVATPIGAQQTGNATTIESGETLEGQIQDANQSDVYSFETQAGDPIELHVSRTGGSGEIRVVVTAPSDSALVRTLGPGETLDLPGTTTESGTYDVEVFPAAANATGSYTISYVNQNRPPIEDPVGDVPDEEIPVLQPNQPVDGQVAGTAEEVFAVNATEGDSIDTELVRSAGDGTFFVGVFGPGGEIKNLAIALPDETLTMTTPVDRTGTYSVAVAGADENASGPFSLTLLDRAPAGATTNDTEPIGASDGNANATDGGASPDANASEIDSCTTITESGTYTLTQDLTDGAEDTCIRIEASDVTLDGDGHLVQGNRTDGDFDAFVAESVGNGSYPWEDEWANHGIAVEGTEEQQLTNVTVRDVETANWFFGVYYQQVEDGSVVDVTASDNGDGISLYNATNVGIENDTVSGNMGGGVTMEDVTDCTITGIDATDNIDGLLLRNLADCTIAGNALTANEDGMFATSLENTTVEDNVASENRWVGLFLSRGGEVAFTNNTVENTTGELAFYGDSSGILLYNTTNNTFEDTTLRNNQNWSFYSMAGAVDNSGTNVTMDETRVEFTATNAAFGTRHEAAGEGHPVRTTNTANESSLDLRLDWLPAADAPLVDEPAPPNGTDTSGHPHHGNATAAGSGGTGDAPTGQANESASTG